MKTEIEEILNGAVSKISQEEIRQYSTRDKDFSKVIDSKKEISFINNKPVSIHQMIDWGGESCSKTTSYHYNSEGLIERLSRMTDGEEVSITIYSYDNSGRMIMEEYSDLNDKEFSKVIYYNYNDEGILEKSDRLNGSTAGICQYLFQNNKLQKVLYLNSDGFSVYREFEYHDSFTIMKFSNGQKNKYNNQGLIIEEYKSDGEVLKKFEYEFDEKANWIKRIEKEYGYFDRVISVRNIVYL